QCDGLPHRLARRFLRRLEIERAGIDLPPRHMHAQQLLHLAQLQLVIGENGQGALLPRDLRLAALEIEARGDLAAEAGEGVIDLGKVQPRDDVETRHGGSAPWRIGSGLYSRAPAPSASRLNPAFIFV